MIAISLKTEGKTKTVGSNTIVINGKHYDAKTGRLLESSHKTKPPTAQPVAKKNGPSIDGFSRKPSKPVASHSFHSKAEKSKTLMRTAVKKPVHHKVHSSTSHTPSSHKATKPQAHVAVQHERIARATNVPKSTLISRFGSTSGPSATVLETKVAHVPVAPAPPVQQHAPVAKHRPGAANPFHSAIENAVSHHQGSPRKPTKRQRVAKALRITPRTVSFGSFIIAGMMLGGFFVYQNIPNLAMRVAATRSGVTAKLPGYKPAGFAMNGPIKYSTGQITVSYRSTTDNRAFQVTQRNSEWNNETLLEKFVSAERRAFQTYQDRGKTIYIYDDNNATWVNDGVWYQVEGKSSLNSDQLLRIANSL